MSNPDKATLVAFGERLRAVRARLEISQEALAHLAGLDRTYISLLERGKRNPSLVCVVKLARAMKVTLPDLCNFAGTEEV